MYPARLDELVERHVERIRTSDRIISERGGVAVPELADTIRVAARRLQRALECPAPADEAKDILLAIAAQFLSVPLAYFAAVYPISKGGEKVEARFAERRRNLVAVESPDWMDEKVREVACILERWGHGGRHGFELVTAMDELEDSLLECADLAAQALLLGGIADEPEPEISQPLPPPEGSFNDSAVRLVSTPPNSASRSRGTDDARAQFPLKVWIVSSAIAASICGGLGIFLALQGKGWTRATNIATIATIIGLFFTIYVFSWTVQQTKQGALDIAAVGRRIAKLAEEVSRVLEKLSTTDLTGGDDANAPPGTLSDEPPATTVEINGVTLDLYIEGADIPVSVICALASGRRQTEFPRFGLRDLQWAARCEGRQNHPWFLAFRGEQVVWKVSYSGDAGADVTRISRD